MKVSLHKILPYNELLRQQMSAIIKSANVPIHANRSNNKRRNEKVSTNLSEHDLIQLNIFEFTFAAENLHTNLVRSYVPSEPVIRHDKPIRSITSFTSSLECRIQPPAWPTCGGELNGRHANHNKTPVIHLTTL